jgi:LPPG:FO 2-phospho-L-lactate transferase
MHLQEFWVKNRARPFVKRVLFEGAKSAVPNEKALAAIRKSSAVIIAPANPISSIGPILAINGFRQALSEVREKVIAVSPIVGESAVSGPAVKYMKAMGMENSPVGIAKYYADLAETLVIAKSDHILAPRIKDLGVNVFETEIIMKNKQAEIRLARYLVDGLRR